MKIQLFVPPVHYYDGAWFKMLPTLGLPIIAAVLNKAGHYAEVVDLEALGIAPEKLKETFEAQQDKWPDAIGITGLFLAAQGIKDTIKALRSAGYDRKIVVGGAFATTSPEEILTWGADLVVTGECEGNVVDLFENGANGVIAGEKMEISDIPSPDWGHFYPPINSYRANMAMLRPNPGISMWTRGCPYPCIFCSNPVFRKQPTRRRPPENIIAEMETLKERGCQNIYVYDDELFGTRMPEGWMKEIADGIEGLGLKWVTQGRCSTKYITPELMKDAKRAGCKVVFWGLESFSPKVLKAIKKHLTPDDIWHTLRVSKEAGIKNAIFTMIGNYKETTDDLALTADNLEKAYKEGLIDYRQTTVATVMQGTELERIQKEEGWYIEPPHAGRDLQDPHTGTPWLTPQQIAYWKNYFAQVCPVGIPQ